MTTTQAMAKTQTQQVEPKRFSDIRSFIESRRDALAALIPKHLSADRLMKVALNSIHKTPKLQECSTSSLMGCIITAAELGLEPGGALGHAYLVPFKGQCTLIIGYRGFVDLMRRSGQLSTIRAVVVHEKDEFTIKEGPEQVIEHRPFLTGDPGLLRFVYAVAKLKDGSYQADFMTRAQVDAIKARSRSSSDGPWVTDYEEMAKKTVIRRIAKLLPLSPETRDAVEKDDEDYIDAEVTSSVVEEAVSVTDSVKAKMAARRKTLVIQDGTQTPAVAETPEPESVPYGEPPDDVVLPTVEGR